MAREKKHKPKTTNQCKPLRSFKSRSPNDAINKLVLHAHHISYAPTHPIMYQIKQFNLSKDVPSGNELATEILQNKKTKKQKHTRAHKHKRGTDTPRSTLAPTKIVAVWQSTSDITFDIRTVGKQKGPIAEQKYSHKKSVTLVLPRKQCALSSNLSSSHKRLFVCTRESDELKRIFKFIYFLKSSCDLKMECITRVNWLTLHFYTLKFICCI